MCGIAGFLDPSKAHGDDVLRLTVRTMADVIFHRGPDDSGEWVDERVGIALSHRRLSIIDLSPEGHQPMVSATGRYIMSYNGEVYNFATLRKMLENIGHSFRGYSDTEVMLTSIEEWGLETAVKQFVGMFAFALWDRQERSLTLVRDRLGIKPLYYGWIDNCFVFGSELKAIRAFPKFNQPIDHAALGLLMRHNCVPAPYSIYKDIRKLPAGSFLTLGEQAVRSELKINSYWSVENVVNAGLKNPFTGSHEEAIDQLDTLLREAVRIRMVADVPLGAFLSGGYDSSTIVALMQEQSNRPVKTFSIGFHDDEYNEANHAKAVATHLGTEHTELYVTAEDVLSVIPVMPKFFCEPFADSSQIPTYIVSKMAREHVTVSLSGDGGDELFAGYNRYFLAQSIWGVLDHIPMPLRKGLAAAIYSVPVAGWNRFYGIIESIIPARYRLQLSGEKLHKAAGVMTCSDGQELYRRMISHWDPTQIMLTGGGQEDQPIHLWPNLPSLTEQMMALDAVSYLPDDILVKVDRASMAVGLEARVPFLDHRVFEFAWRLPLDYKLQNGAGKWILKQVLYKYVPKKLMERPKMGFGVPIDRWLRGPLRDWAEELLNESRLKQEGYFDPAPIRRKWMEHLSGKRNWQYHLWDVLMFQGWQDSL